MYVNDSGAYTPRPGRQRYLVEGNAGIVLGHRRLSIIDLSPQGHQPMHSICRRYTIVLNGEIYNFQELRRELHALGHVFKGHSDAEILFAASSAVCSVRYDVGPSVLQRYVCLRTVGCRAEYSLSDP